MRSPRLRADKRMLVIGAVSVLVLLVGACGNSKAKTDAGSTQTTSGAGPTVAPGQKVAVDAPGITDSEIRVGGVASVKNPLGGRYGDSFAGTKAYFDMVNASGGIYGRKLVLAAERDDQLANNKSEVQGLLTQDKVFAVLPVASLLFSGAQTLVDQNVPTFGWTVNVEWQGSKEDPRANMFGQSGSYLGFSNATAVVPWVAGQAEAHKVGLLAYAVPQSSDCADGVKNSFAKYGPLVDAEVAFVDQSLSYGVSDLSVQVSKMKKEGVDFVTTCMDNDGVVSLAKEMKKQRLSAPQYMPNSYDHDFLDEFGDLFEGSYVRTDFVQWEVPSKPEGLTNFLTWIAKQDIEPTENAIVGWLNADLFVSGLRAAGPAFSRQKLIDAINAMSDYTGNGVVNSVDWRTAHSQAGNTCLFLSQIKDGEFDPVFSKPGKPFVCPKATATSIDTTYSK